MRKTLLHLGSTPLMRRIVAAVMLLAGVGIVTWLRPGDGHVGMELALNSAAACAAFAFLHMRWRKRERSEMTPAKAEDIFS
jgi:hypothetical protein